MKKDARWMMDDGKERKERNHHTRTFIGSFFFISHSFFPFWGTCIDLFFFLFFSSLLLSVHYFLIFSFLSHSYLSSSLLSLL